MLSSSFLVWRRAYCAKNATLSLTAASSLTVLRPFSLCFDNPTRFHSLSLHLARAQRARMCLIRSYIMWWIYIVTYVVRGRILMPRIGKMMVFMRVIGFLSDETCLSFFIHPLTFSLRSHRSDGCCIWASGVVSLPLPQHVSYGIGIGYRFFIRRSLSPSGIEGKLMIIQFFFRRYNMKWTMQTYSDICAVK